MRREWVADQCLTERRGGNRPLELPLLVHPSLLCFLGVQIERWLYLASMARRAIN